MEYDLYHHGVKGMKWGVRRYQNKNGSYTPAGKKRYTTILEGKLKAEKAATDARRNAYKTLNESSKRHSKFQYDVAATAAGYKARKESVIAQKEANRQRREENRAARKPLTDNQKKALKIGAVAVGTALAVYGGKKIYDVAKTAKAIKGAEAADRALAAMAKSEATRLSEYNKALKDMMSTSTHGTLNMFGMKTDW